MTSTQPQSSNKGAGRGHGNSSPRKPQGSAANAMLEKELQREVIALARSLGYMVKAEKDNRRQVIKDGRKILVGDEQGAGFPDLCMAGRGRFLFIELKTQAGTVTEKQAEWLERLSEAAKVCPGTAVYLWRPSHWFDGTIERELRRVR